MTPVYPGIPLLSFSWAPIRSGRRSRTSTRPSRSFPRPSHKQVNTTFARSNHRHQHLSQEKRKLTPLLPPLLVCPFVRLLQHNQHTHTHTHTTHYPVYQLTIYSLSDIIIQTKNSHPGVHSLTPPKLVNQNSLYNRRYIYCQARKIRI